MRNPLRSIWGNMIRRCVDPSFKDWHLYGGRLGNPVTVCERWQVYQNFVQDIPKRPSMAHTIDRIDGTKGYEPGNVKWSTATEQARNTTRNIFFEHGGLRLTFAEWAERSGMEYASLYYRVFEAKMPFADAISIPIGTPTKAHCGRDHYLTKLFNVGDEMLTMKEWADRLGIRYTALKNRLNRGLPMERVASPSRLAHAKHTTGGRQVAFNGKTQTISRWAEELGLPYKSLASRFNRGWAAERALTEPFKKPHT